MSDRQQGQDPPDLACNEFVELVTDYLEAALPADQRASIDHHLEGCSGCRSILAQWGQVIRLTGRLRDTEVDETEPDVRRQLMDTFRQNRRHHG